MATNRITDTENFETLIEIVGTCTHPRKDDLIKFIEHKMNLIEKKKASKTPTAQQEQNEETMKNILDILRNKESMTITEITKTAPICDIPNISVHRVSALVAKLKNTNKVKRTEVKGVARFSINEEAEEVGE